MEKKKKISWFSLFIKIIIAFIFILIIIWLISKIIRSNNLSEEFNNNLNNMENASIEYFKTIDLPQKKGQSIKVTLKELLEKGFINTRGDEPNITCDTEESHSKIVREENKYIVNTTLKCGKEKNNKKIDFMFENCKNCNSKNDNTTNGNNQVATPETYYEYIKETTEYTKWIRGNLTGENIENRTDYYSIDHQVYYIVGIIPINNKTTTFTLKLNSVPNNKYYFTSIDETETFSIEEKEKYLSDNKVSIYKGYDTEINIKNLEKNSLKEKNFTYKLSPYYSKGNFYIRVTINMNNTDEVIPYYDSKLKKSIYFVPLKITIKFASNEILDTKPTTNYETIPYYRYVIKNKDIIWSKEASVEGYTKTGKTKIK